MSMNVHNLLHLRGSVEQLGPLWANSLFEFESANGELKSLFHSSQNIDMQVGSYRSRCVLFRCCKEMLTG